MLRQPPKPAELVPVVDRYLWMVGCRSLTTALLTALLIADGTGPGRLWLIACAGSWLVLSQAAVPGVRRSRRVAAIAMSLSLLGDAALLSAGWWMLGGPGSVLERVIGAHILGVTLLASFRTGVKLALWYTVLAYVLIEANAAGLLGPDDPDLLPDMILYLGSLWLITGLTAAFAAVNERELRRRRYDSEVLRLLALDLNRHQPARELVARLATFARDDMFVERLVVLVYPLDDRGGPTLGFGLTADARGRETLTGLHPEVMDDCVRRAGTGPDIDARTSIDPHTDANLAGLLPGRGQLVLIPFAGEQVRGVVAAALRSRGLLRSARVERRIVDALHQATLQTGTAISRELLSARLRLLAETDALTGLANRGTFNRRLRQLVDAAPGGAPVALILVDLDHFKRVNDGYGHQAGDTVLQVTAATLRTWTPPDGLAARWGGEEFAVIVPGLDAAAAMAHAERIRQSIETAPTPVPVTASLGVAVHPRDGGDGEALLARADAALYRAKDSGRNRVATAWSDRAPAPAV